MAWRKMWGGVDTPMHTMKLDALLHKTCIKVRRLNMCTSMILLSKMVHQIWHDHPFSQKKQGNRISSGVGVGDNRELRGHWTKFEKEGQAI